MSKPKKTDTFTFIRKLFGTPTTKPTALKVEQRKADEEVLDRAASVALSLAEHLAPQAIADDDPAKLVSALGAIREARECVKARKEVTGGGLGGGIPTSTDSSVIMRVDHQGLPVSDDFNTDIAATNADLAVQTRSA